MKWSKCNPPCRAEQLDSNFYAKVRKIEDLVGYELSINSAYRTYEHEIKKGRSGSSSHCKGVAVDIHTSNSLERFDIVRAAIQSGIRRIGIYRTFVHIDDDSTKPTCIFLG